jgi:hypothetical protein
MKDEDMHQLKSYLVPGRVDPAKADDTSCLMRKSSFAPCIAIILSIIYNDNVSATRLLVDSVPSM